LTFIKKRRQKQLYEGKKLAGLLRAGGDGISHDGCKLHKPHVVMRAAECGGTAGNDLKGQTAIYNTRKKPGP
jgi:hypothetical protein